MTTEQFAYWLQGFSEIHGTPPSAEQWGIIKDHLQTCFKKITPDRLEIYVKDGESKPGLGQPGIVPLNINKTPFTITC